MVGIDFPLTVVDRVAGNAMGSQDSTDRIVKQSTAFFPEIELEICELEAFRGIGSVGDAASCTTTYNSADFVHVKEFLSKKVVHQQNFKRTVICGVCCVVDETTPDMHNQCGLSGNNTGNIVLNGSQSSRQIT